MYDKGKILARLRARQAQHFAEAKESEKQAIENVDPTAAIDLVKFKVEQLNGALEQENWSRVGSLGYDVYSAAAKVRVNAEPNFINRDQNQRKGEAITAVIDLLEGAKGDTVSTTELEKLGVINVIKYGS